MAGWGVEVRCLRGGGWDGIGMGLGSLKSRVKVGEEMNVELIFGRKKRCMKMGKKHSLTCFMARIDINASTAPAAPSKCPRAPLVLLTLTSAACRLHSSGPFPSSMSRLMARSSAASPITVPVACALM